MNKLFSAFCLTLIAGLGIFAQSDVKRTEFYVGYSNNQVEAGNGGNNNGNSVQNFFDNRLSFNGVEAAGVVNVHRFIGIKGDFSATYRNRDFTNTTATSGNTSTTVGFETKSSLYNFLGGVQIKDNASDAKIKPFAHALIGAGYGRTKVSNLNCSSGVSTSVCSNLVVGNSDTGLAGAIGGGLDVKLNDRLNLRVIQVDYNPVHINNRTLDNVRFGAGITF